MLAQPERTIAAHTAEDAVRAIEHAANDGGTWIVALSYELGAAFEPRALPRHRAPSDGWPLATLVRCGPSLEFRLEEGGEHWSWGLPEHGDGIHAEAAHLAAEIIARRLKLDLAEPGGGSTTLNWMMRSPKRKPEDGDPLRVSERRKFTRRPTQQVGDLVGTSVADIEPNDLRRRASDDRARDEVVILRHDQQASPPRELPDGGVGAPPAESEGIVHMHARESRREQSDEPRAQVLVEQQVHAAGCDRTRRSRSAA
jgi:hypothetical protein